MSALLRLYPRAWRERYGAEVEELLAAEPRTLRVWLDLIAGALDARMNPQWTPATKPEGGHETMSTFLSSCGRASYPPQQQRKSAFLMLAASLALVLVYFALNATLGESVFLQALLYATFNIALVLSSIPTFLHNYSPRVRAALVALGVVSSYAFFLGVTMLADRI